MTQQYLIQRLEDLKHRFQALVDEADWLLAHDKQVHARSCQSWLSDIELALESSTKDKYTLTSAIGELNK